MIISFIGMSGSGKTYWSKKLSGFGFKHYCCDDLIEERLSSRLKKLGYSGIADMSRWMGQPYDQRYRKTSRQYLKLEQEVVGKIISDIKMGAGENIVIDTTGSLIYINPGILKKLREISKVFYLEVPKRVKDEMFRLYINDPKPVIWGEMFKIKQGEDKMITLKNSYPGLLNYRSRQYVKLADRTLDYDLLRQDGFSAKKLLSLLQK